MIQDTLLTNHNFKTFFSLAKLDYRHIINRRAPHVIHAKVQAITTQPCAHSQPPANINMSLSM